jgi:tetratricopeptide (TPR) repeat protein
MMLERHYDEESLIALLHSGEASASSDPHLSGCISCADMLESYRVISEVLGAKIVWELHETPDSAAGARGIATIRAFAESMENEEKPAVALVSELLSSPRQWWVATVERDERYHNAGVLRHLIEVSEAKIDTMPPEAVVTAAAAIAVAETLGDAEHVRQLHGTAYRQHAFALLHTGEFPRALASIEDAQEILDGIAVSEYAIARLNIVRALVYRALERNDEALALARRSAAASLAELPRGTADPHRDRAPLLERHRPGHPCQGAAQHRDLPEVDRPDRRRVADLPARGGVVRRARVGDGLCKHPI